MSKIIVLRVPANDNRMRPEYHDYLSLCKELKTEFLVPGAHHVSDKVFDDLFWFLNFEHAWRVSNESSDL